MSCDYCSCAAYTRYNGSLFQNLRPHDLMVIGESPTAAEARMGKILTGNGAQVLRETMAKVGLPVDTTSVYYTTAIKCAVPKKKGQKFPFDAPGCCREYLLHEVRAVQPKMILVCGATALATLTGNNKLKITEEYGRVREYDFLPNTKVIPIMNPGVLLHKPGDYKPFLSMLTLAATIYKGGSTIDTGETKWIVCDTKEKCVSLWRLMNEEFRLGHFTQAAYDIETTGLDYRVVDFLVMGICFKKNLSYVIPREMSQYVHNFLEGIPWHCIWQNGKYDKKVMWRRNLGNVSIDEDTQYMHYVLDETSSHDLGYLSKTFLNAAEYKFKMNQNWKVVSLDNFESFREAIYERVAVDCDYTLQLAEVFQEIHNKPENTALRDLYKGLIIPAANYLARVEQNGLLIDAEYLNAMDEKYTVLLASIMEEIHVLAAPFWDPHLYMQQMDAKSAPPIFNPGSPKQMSWMVFDRLKLKPRIKKGRSTDKDILKSIENPPALVLKVLEYRTVQKEHSTYVLGLLNARDDDGRVRSTFNLHVTATGRLSSKEPNVQNQPSANGVGNIRKAFIAPPGRLLAEIDYSGAELRWLAFLSKCPVLSDVFVQGRNLHHETAVHLFGEHYTKKQKMRAKAVNFGIPYGITASTIADEHNITVEEAQEMIDGWNAKYYGAAEYLAWCALQVHKGNYLETPFGRRRRFGLVSQQSISGLENEARNFPIQSSSSDLLLKCSIEMEHTLKQNFDTNILNMIHDSDLLEMPAQRDIVTNVGIYANNVMTQTPKQLFNCPIPFKTDFEIGVNWGELYTYNCKTQRIEIENPDDSITELEFDDWYAMALKG